MLATRSVAKGAALFDREIPGWHRHVEPELLDLNSWDNCVLGQIAKAYSGWIKDVEERFFYVAKELGFGVVSARTHGIWRFTRSGNRALEREWAAAIRHRRELDEIVITRHPRVTQREKVLA